MRTRLIALTVALAAAAQPAWAGGCSGYTGYLAPQYRSPVVPPNAQANEAAAAREPDYMDSCRKTISAAEAGLSRTRPENVAKAQHDIELARVSMSEGKGFACVNQAHNAMRWEG
jgi:hypothetical protein